MNIVIPVILLFLFVICLISINNDLKEKKVVREIILNEEKIEKICFLESLISSRMVREYEKYKILAGRYNTLTISEYRQYLERLGYYYEKKHNFRERIKEIIQRYPSEPDRWEMYNYVNTYDMIYRNSNGEYIEDDKLTMHSTLLHNFITTQNTTTTATLQGEDVWGSSWIAGPDYYHTSFEKEKTNPTKEMCKHLIKICKNKKGV